MAGSRQITSLLLPNWFPCHLSSCYPFSILPHGSERVISGLISVPSNNSKPQVLSRMNEVHRSLAPAKCFSFISFFLSRLFPTHPTFPATPLQGSTCPELLPLLLCLPAMSLSPVHLAVPPPKLLLKGSVQMSPSLRT